MTESFTKSRRQMGSLPTPFTTADERWQAVASRDPAAEGAFFYSVATTGIYCRPNCAARLPRREHVRFHATSAEAERAGFRPCKRCRPRDASRTERQAAIVAQACRLIEEAEKAPSLDALAKSAGLSRFHFQRLFKGHTGVTPKGYAAAHRAKRLREVLARGRSVTRAIYGAGYNSSSRFYESSREVLGMTPKVFRAGGTKTAMRFAVGECSLGSILVAASDKGVCAILLGDDPDALVRDLQDRFPKADLVGGDAKFEQWIAQVIGFVENPSRGLGLPLDIRGTAFQRSVWEALRKVPAGTITTYAEIAKRLGCPQSGRAVGQAIAANPIAVAIPCHRVIRTDGALSGYRWGARRKRALQRRERAARE